MSSAGLHGRVALVTGAGRNIGRSIALALAQAGAAVAINGHRDRAALAAVAAEIEAGGGRALPVLADVGDPAAVDALVGAVESALGPVQILVSNVAVRPMRPFLEISDAEWHAVLDTNLSASFYLSRRTLPGMRAGGWGRIVTLSGLDGVTGHMALRAHNVVAKAGVIALAKAIAREFGAFGITANAIAPGAIDTVRDWSQYPHYDPAEVVRQIPAGRLGRVEDVAAACAFLCSDAAAFVNGQTLHLNGGQYMF